MLSIIDSHVHFWDPAHLRYDWLAGSAILNQVYRPERLPGRATAGEWKNWSSCRPIAPPTMPRQRQMAG
jgi:hypothetical protein